MPKHSLVVDHLGNEFPSVEAMCECWGISRKTYVSRRDRGWTLERALTEYDAGQAKPATDHEGNGFPSIKAMCRHWGVDDGTYACRRKNGWTIERALTKPVDRKVKPATDHLGNEFPSKSAMCRHWGVSYCCFQFRRERGCTIEQALTGDGLRRRGRPGQSCVDHLGNEFPSQAAMCRRWGVPASTYLRRRERGLTVGQALTWTRGQHAPVAGEEPSHGDAR